MGNTRIARIIFNTIYIIGLVIILCLGVISLFGSKEFLWTSEYFASPTWADLAFLGLALGAVPMLLACMGAYKFNKIKDSKHKKRNFILIFMPGFICSGCALYVIGAIVIIYILFLYLEL